MSTAYIVYVETTDRVQWRQMQVFENQQPAEDWARKYWRHCNRQVERHINGAFHSTTLTLEAETQS